MLDTKSWNTILFVNTAQKFVSEYNIWINDISVSNISWTELDFTNFFRDDISL